MKPVAWMVAASGVAWLLVTATLGRPRQSGSPVGHGGPLVSAVVSWVAYVRAHEIGAGAPDG